MTDGLAQFMGNITEALNEADKDVTAVETVSPESAKPTEESVVKIVDDANASISDVEKTVTDSEHVDIPAMIADFKADLDELKVMVTDVKNLGDEVKPLIAAAGPALEAITNEVKTKGIAGLLPVLMQAIKG